MVSFCCHYFQLEQNRNLGPNSCWISPLFNCLVTLQFFHCCSCVSRLRVDIVQSTAHLREDLVPMSGCQPNQGVPKKSCLKFSLLNSFFVCFICFTAFVLPSDSNTLFLTHSPWKSILVPAIEFPGAPAWSHLRRSGPPQPYAPRHGFACLVRPVSQQCPKCHDAETQNSFSSIILRRLVSLVLWKRFRTC